LINLQWQYTIRAASENVGKRTAKRLLVVCYGLENVFASRRSLFVVAADVVLRQSSILRGSIRPALLLALFAVFFSAGKKYANDVVLADDSAAGVKENDEKIFEKSELFNGISRHQ
jgi:hypothetical protein